MGNIRKSSCSPSLLTSWFKVVTPFGRLFDGCLWRRGKEAPARLADVAVPPQPQFDFNWRWQLQDVKKGTWDLERNLERNLARKSCPKDYANCRCDVEDPVDADADAVKRLYKNIEDERQVCKNISEWTCFWRKADEDHDVQQHDDRQEASKFRCFFSLMVEFQPLRYLIATNVLFRWKLFFHSLQMHT